MEKMQHFSIRKLSIGAASVLIGISFLGVKASTVKADSLTVDASETELTKSKAANEVIKQDADSDIKHEPASNIDTKQDTGSNIKQESASKTDAKQITNNQPNYAQTPAKPATPKPNSNQQNAADLEAKPQTPDKVKLQANRTITSDEANRTEVAATTLKATTGKKFNAKMLFASKIMSPAKNTNDAFALNPENGLHEHANVNDNGGYDEDYWGKLNINDWNYTTNGNTITITGYKGNNPSSLIIPNGADFDFANRRDTVQSNAEISSSVMHDLAKNATRIGLSKTANKKVVAEDDIWQNAFGGLTNKPGTTDNAYGGIKYGSPNLTQMDLHNLDTASITNMSALFNGGSNLTTVGDLSEWNTSNITNMRVMFQAASSLTNIGNLDNWDTSNVIDMTSMFSNATSLTNIGDLSKWQTANVIDMNNMFSNATNLTNIGNLDNWNTSKVTDMHWMFGTDSGKQSHLTNIGDLSKWQTGNVTDMNNMFANATSLTNIGNLDNWDTNKVTDMHNMFDNTTSLTNIGDLSKWQTGNVTDMHNMFDNTTSLTNIGDLSKWQTGNVTDMHNMFTNATSLTNIGNLDNWDTSKVTNMSWMFGTDSGKQSHLTNIGDLSKWQTGNVTDMHDMFANATQLTNIGDLSKWQTGNVTNMSYMFMSAKALRHLNISNWNLTKLVNKGFMKYINKDSMKYMFANDVNLTVIANDLKLPAWYQNEINDADYFWNNHMAVITNVPELIRATGDIDNLKIDDQNASRSIFYDSKGSSDAIQVLKDANNQYIADYNKANPTKVLKLADTVDQNDPISLANASFVTKPSSEQPSPEEPDYKIVVKTRDDIDPNKLAAAKWQFTDADDNNKAIADSTILIVGNSGDTFTKDQITLPKGYEDRNDLLGKNAATFKLPAAGTTTVYTLPLSHHHTDLTKQAPEDEVKQTRSITVHYKYLAGDKANQEAAPDAKLDVYYSRSKFKDDVTGKISYTPWFWDKSQGDPEHPGYHIVSGKWDNLPEQWDNVIANVPTIAGYTAVLDEPNRPDNVYHVNANIFVHPLWNDLLGSGTTDATKDSLAYLTTNTLYEAKNEHTVYYKANKQQNTIKFVDDDNEGTEVGNEQTITGVTDQTVDLNLQIPKNYELAEGTKLPTSFKFAQSNTQTPIEIHLKHKTETSVESLPATRTINVHLPNGTTKVYQQIIGYQRNVITDLVTKTVTRDKWAVNDVTSSFTIDGVKQLEQSYVLRNGNYNFAGIKLPKVPGYTAHIKPVSINPNMRLFAVSFIALPKPVTLTPNDVEPAKTVTPATTETAELIKTESKVATTPKTINLSDDIVATTPKTINLSDYIVTNTPKTINLSDYIVTNTPKEATWQIANEPERDTYRVSNGKYTVELPHINNTQLHVIANDSTKDSILFTYKGQNTKYVFNIKFANGHYLLTTYEIKSGKLVKLIDYNFIKSSKMSDIILDWLKL